MLNEAFLKLKTNLELSDTLAALVEQRHNAIRSVVEHNNSSAETKLIGSFQRKTTIHPRENDQIDVDILVVLGDFNSWVTIGGVTPQAAMTQMNAAISESSRYSRMGVVQDDPTVSVEYSDNLKIEFVPAYRDNIGYHPNGTALLAKGRGYWIAKDGSWVHADYDYEADFVINQNKNCDGLLVPTIKMLKSIKRQYFPTVSSFPLEIIASNVVPVLVEVYIKNDLQPKFSDLITHFFGPAKNYLGMPLKIPGSNSPDHYIPLDAQTQAIKAFDAIDQYCKNINTLSNDIERHKRWRNLFNEVFPSV